MILHLELFDYATVDVFDLDLRPGGCHLYTTTALHACTTTIPESALASGVRDIYQPCHLHSTLRGPHVYITTTAIYNWNQN